MSVETVEAFDPNPTLGALLIGTLLGSILFGVTTAQAYIYYKRFPDDHWAIKATVVLERGRVHESTRTFLDKLILWSLETGLITSSFSLITVILFHTMPKNLFSNSFFASLNSRTVLRELRDNKNGQMLSWTNPALRQTATAPQQLPISVSVAVHTMQDVDSDQDTELTLMPVKETEHC
ncbi:hypothetical protein MIND_01273200 [Mycena indigotica]|uniref:DUF6534 domain-containing protein n=1 Tax=Mycena indigotica TaxID=2126181 RepID=A0A8H6S2T6_9AGAR|nr:uncharacterized protein MIND_01273200 [Mycena indigotica]KAF7291293.1 hypothetical protein MIND_01273200 [Mycena indigotica]